MSKIRKLKINDWILDFSFLAIAFICLNAFYTSENKIKGVSINALIQLLGYLVLIIIINTFPLRKIQEDRNYSNKKALWVFAGVFCIFLIIILFDTFYLKINNANGAEHKVVAIIEWIILTLSIFISKLWGVKLSNFNWKVKIKQVILVLVLFLVNRGIAYSIEMYYGKVDFANIFTFTYMLKFTFVALQQMIYPAIYEEVLYRGFLISGLKGLGLNNNITNVIQAIAFGLMHIVSYGIPNSFVQCLFVAGQATMGYILGKLYFKTNSLLPGIILHGLFDTL